MVVNNFGMDVAAAEYVKLPGLVLKTSWDGNEEASLLPDNPVACGYY